MILISTTTMTIFESTPYHLHVRRHFKVTIQCVSEAYGVVCEAKRENSTDREDKTRYPFPGRVLYYSGDFRRE